MAFGDYATLISGFSGGDEDPLSEGGHWLPVQNVFPLTHLKKTAGGVVTNTNDPPDFIDKHYYYTPKFFGPDAESYYTVGGAFTDDWAFDLGLRISNPTASGDPPASVWNGYFVQVKNDGTWVIYLALNGVAEVLSTVSQGLAATDRMGFRIQGFTIDTWLDTGSDFGQVQAVTDTSKTFPGSGWASIGCAQSTGTIDDFYAGTIPSRSGVWVNPRGAPLSRRAG